jgi:hypothetical protein
MLHLHKIYLLAAWVVYKGHPRLAWLALSTFVGKTPAALPAHECLATPAQIVESNAIKEIPRHKGV